MSEIISDLEGLHDAFRVKLLGLLAESWDDGITLDPYETLRTPFRQAALYAKGRTSPGPMVTKAQPWESAHQYGMAADLVFWDGDKGWSWNEPRPGLWAKLGELAKKHGLEQLSFEKPHVQMPRWQHLTAGLERWPQWSRDQWALWNKPR